MTKIDETLAERGARYGDFTDHAEVAQALQDVMRGMPNWRDGKLSAVQRQALTVIADKIARIGTGDPNYRDNYHDIQGYAKLAEDRCAPEFASDIITTSLEESARRTAQGHAHQDKMYKEYKAAWGSAF